MNIKCVLHSVCLHTRLGSVAERVLWLGVQARAKRAYTQVEVEERSDSETVFLPFYTATRHAFSHYNPFSEAFIFLFCQGGEGNFYCNHVQRSHMFLSSVPCFPTKCPTSPVVIPGCGLHTISSLLCVDVLAAAVSCGSTALGFCTLLLWQSSNTNVVSAATLLSNVNAIG